MCAEVPAPLLPSHCRRVERGEQGRPGRRPRCRLQVVGEHVAGRPVQVDRGVRDRGERASRLARRPARPPTNVRLARRAERAQPTAQELGLGGRGLDPLERRTEPRPDRHPPVLAAGPASARATARDRSLGGEQRESRLPALASICQRPEPRRTFSARRGSARVRSAVNASPRDSERCEGRIEALVDPAGRIAIHAHAASTDCTSRFRSRAAITRVHAASTTGASSRGTTQSVRRMPSIRTSVRSSYSARSRSTASKPAVRAQVERYTVAASVDGA